MLAWPCKQRQCSSRVHKPSETTANKSCLGTDNSSPSDTPTATASNLQCEKLRLWEFIDELEAIELGRVTALGGLRFVNHKEAGLILGTRAKE